MGGEVWEGGWGRVNPLLLAGIHSPALTVADRKGCHGTPDLIPPQARPSPPRRARVVTHHHPSLLIITHHHPPSLIITRRHSSELFITHHHSSSLIITHHHSSSLIITHHHSSPLIITHHHSFSTPKSTPFGLPFYSFRTPLGGGGLGRGLGPPHLSHL